MAKPTYCFSLNINCVTYWYLCLLTDCSGVPTPKTSANSSRASPEEGPSSGFTPKKIVSAGRQHQDEVLTAERKRRSKFTSEEIGETSR